MLIYVEQCGTVLNTVVILQCIIGNIPEHVTREFQNIALYEWIIKGQSKDCRVHIQASWTSYSTREWADRCHNTTSTPHHQMVELKATE